MRAESSGSSANSSAFKGGLVSKHSTVEGSPTRRPVTSLPPVLRMFALWSVLLGVGCVGTAGFCRFVLHLAPNPYGSIALPQGEDHGDARMFDVRIHHFHEHSFFSADWGSPFLYPAPNAVFYRVFAFTPEMHKPFLIGIAILILALAIGLLRELRRRGVATLPAALFSGAALLSSYPFYFELNRANVEIYISGLSGLGIWAFLRDRPWLAATLIGVAGGCKGYPFLYLGLLFARKQYRQVVYSVVVGLLLNLACTWAIADSFAIGWKGVADGMRQFREMYVLHARPMEMGLDHSIFGTIKHLLQHAPSPNMLSRMLTGYLVCGALTGCALYFFRAYRLPAINQVIFLTVACITLPPTSYDYTLLHLYTGWVLMVLLAIDLWRNECRMPAGLWAAFICFVLLLSPQNEFIYHAERLEGPIKCLTLLMLAYIVLRYPFYFFEERKFSVMSPYRGQADPRKA